MAEHNKGKPLDEKDVQAVIETLDAQIKSLRAQLPQVQNKPRLEQDQLVQLMESEKQLQYQESLVNRLYEKRGLRYSLAVKMPLKILNVGSLSDSQRFVRDSFRGVTSPMCVICHGGILMHKPEQVPVDGKVKWFCSNPNCSYEVWAAPASKDLMMLDVRQQINGEAWQVGKERWKTLSQEEKQELIENHLSKAKVFRFVAYLLTAVVAFELLLQYWMALMVMLPILFLTILLSLKWCFRAWQMKTGNVFLPKSMFSEWMRTAKYYYSVDWIDELGDDEKGKYND